MMSLTTVQKLADRRQAVIGDLTEQLAVSAREIGDCEKELEEKHKELLAKADEVKVEQRRFLEMELRFKKETEKRAEAEVLSDNLRDVLAKMDESQKEKDAEIKRLTSITAMITQLIVSNPSAESLHKSREGNV